MGGRRGTGDQRRDGGTIRRALILAVSAGLLLAVSGGLAIGLRPGGDPAPTATEGDYTVWERNADGTPVRWDPCAPVPFVLQPAGAPPNAEADLRDALRRLGDAAGMDLVLLGTTDEHPHDARLPFQPERYGARWAPVLVAWADPGVSGLRDTDRGIAEPVAVGHPGHRGYVSGQVVLNRERTDLRPGFGDRADAWGATLLHEIAHVLGLGHVEAPEQLMHVYPGDGPVVLGAGDRAGLSAVGGAEGCRPAPAARPVEVARPATP